MKKLLTQVKEKQIGLDWDLLSESLKRSQVQGKASHEKLRLERLGESMYRLLSGWDWMGLREDFRENDLLQRCVHQAIFELAKKADEKHPQRPGAFANPWFLRDALFELVRFLESPYDLDSASNQQSRLDLSSKLQNLVLRIDNLLRFGSTESQGKRESKRCEMIRSINAKFLALKNVEEATRQDKDKRYWRNASSLFPLRASDADLIGAFESFATEVRSLLSEWTASFDIPCGINTQCLQSF